MAREEQRLDSDGCPGTRDTGLGHHSPNGSELSVLFAGTYGIGMCRSFDNGQTWEKINSGLTARYETCLASSSRDIFVGADFVNGAGG